MIAPKYLRPVVRVTDLPETSQVKFKKLLKTHFFNLAFSGWLRVLFSWFVVYTIFYLVMRMCSFSNECNINV